MNDKGSIFITGVSQRIGLHLAKCLIKKGYHVIGTYRTRRESIFELQNLGVELYKVDFYLNDDIESLINTLKKNHTALRAIIHNASEWLTDPTYSQEAFEKMFQLHVHLPYKLNMALSSLLLNADSEFSDIIHFSDYASATGSTKHTAYTASKAALDNLTLSFAARLAPKVKVNSIAPGLILFNENDTEMYREKALKKALIQREGGLAEISEVMFYLLNSRFVTGRVLPVDGGRHLAHKTQAPIPTSTQAPSQTTNTSNNIIDYPDSARGLRAR